REGSPRCAEAPARVGRNVRLQPRVEEDATVPMLDEIEEVRAEDLGARVLVQRIERREIRAVTAAETGEHPHWTPADIPKSIERLAPVIGAARSCARYQISSATSSAATNRALSPCG